jgi:hypothetical protein
MKLNVVSFSVAQDENPDFMKFDAVVGYIDTPTDATPCGGVEGYQIVISSEGMDVRSLVGSGVNVAWSDGWFSDAEDTLKSHDPRFKVGVIDSAQVVGNQIMASGHLWKADFPDVCDTIECAKESLGCSVEAYFNGYKKNDEAKTITGFGAHFTGVAILYKNKAAFTSTKIMCSIQEQEEDNLNEEMKKTLETMFSEQNKVFEAKFEAINEAMDKFKKPVAELSAKTENGVTEESVAKNDKVELSSVAQVIADAIKAGFEAMKNTDVTPGVAVAKAVNSAEPTRKTAAFSTTPQMSESKEKTAMELAAEIDADENLTPDQKWAKKVDLWNEHRAEFKNA